MPRLRLAVVALASSLALVGCASRVDPDPVAIQPAADADATPTAAPDEPAPPPPVVLSEDMPPADDAGQARADAWLAGVPVPPGAVALDAAPDDAPTLRAQGSGWWCSPMGIATGYWRVPGTTVADATSWLVANPGDGLVTSTPHTIAPDADVDGATVGHVPSLDALEGVVILVARAADGVVLRANVGAFGDTTECPTPPPGTTLGGPGQG